MSKYTDTWKRNQLVADPERFSRHNPPHSGTTGTRQPGFSPVELQATAPASDLSGQIVTDAVVGYGSPAYPIDRTPSLGGRGRDWTRGMSGAGEGGVQRTGFNSEQKRTLFGSDACAAVSADQFRARARSYGAGEYGTHAFESHGPHGQMYGEHRSTALSNGLGTTPLANQGGGYEQYRRGLNADPLNDGTATGGPGISPRPTAWRVGEDDGSLWWPARYLRTHIDRIFRPTRQLPTDQVQINPTRTPQIIVSAPPPGKSSKGGGLFDSLAKFVPKAVPIAGIARTPGPWYESVQAEAEPQNLSLLPDYSGVVNG